LKVDGKCVWLLKCLTVDRTDLLLYNKFERSWNKGLELALNSLGNSLNDLALYWIIGAGIVS